MGEDDNTGAGIQVKQSDINHAYTFANGEPKWEKGEKESIIVEQEVHDIPNAPISGKIIELFGEKNSRNTYTIGKIEEAYISDHESLPQYDGKAVTGMPAPDDKIIQTNPLFGAEIQEGEFYEYKAKSLGNNPNSLAIEQTVGVVAVPPVREGVEPEIPAVVVTKSFCEELDKIKLILERFRKSPVGDGDGNWTFSASCEVTDDNYYENWKEIFNESGLIRNRSGEIEIKLGAKIEYDFEFLNHIPYANWLAKIGLCDGGLYYEGKIHAPIFSIFHDERKYLKNDLSEEVFSGGGGLYGETGLNLSLDDQSTKIGLRCNANDVVLAILNEYFSDIPIDIIKCKTNNNEIDYEVRAEFVLEFGYDIWLRVYNGKPQIKTRRTDLEFNIVGQFLCAGNNGGEIVLHEGAFFKIPLVFYEGSKEGDVKWTDL